jgi:GNAT superfamily N-acetyltransferase
MQHATRSGFPKQTGRATPDERLSGALRDKRRSSSPLAKRLASADRPRIVEHFNRLSDTDRYLRFGAPAREQVLRSYVDGIDFDRSVVYGVHADDLTLIAVVHVASSGSTAEIGLSVLEGWRTEGIGQLLLERAVSWARSKGIRTVFMHCLAENAIIRRLAKRAGMNIVADHGEVDAHLVLAPAKLGSASCEAMLDGVALFDFWLKRQALAAQRFRRAISETTHAG